MNCSLSEVLKTDLQNIVVTNSVLIKIIPYRRKALRNQDNFHCTHVEDSLLRGSLTLAQHNVGLVILRFVID